MTKIERKLFARIDKAVWEYKLIEKDDCILVAVSGGADSMALLKLLQTHAWIYASNITVKAAYIDLGYGNRADERCRIMNDYFEALNVEGKILRTKIGPYAQSEENRENPCFLCARIRRKKVFEIAGELGCNKIAMGHHKNDIIETLLLNMIFSREISTMPPKVAFFQGKYHIIRPLMFVEEHLLKRYAREHQVPTFSSNCPT